MSTLEGIVKDVSAPADNLGTPTSRAISLIEAITSAFPVPWEQQAESIGGDAEQMGQDVVVKGMVSLWLWVMNCHNQEADRVWGRNCCSASLKGLEIKIIGFYRSHQGLCLMATLCISHRKTQTGRWQKQNVTCPPRQEKETEKWELGFSHWIRLRKGSQESCPQDQGVGMICGQCLFHYKSNHRAQW